MSTVILIIVLLAAVGAAASLAAARVHSRRDLVVQRPLEFIDREIVRHEDNMRLSMSRRSVAQRDLDERIQALRAEAGPDCDGVALVLRVLAVVVVTVLFVLSLILNVEIFVALNGGLPGLAAVAKGIGASVLELLLAIVTAHLIRHSKPRSAAWQAKFWAALAFLAITVVLVYHYAPARSQQAIGPDVALAERVLAQAENPPDGQPDPQAISAALRKLEDDQKRLREAENSDQAQSILFPLGEVLGGELALQGGVALVALIRRRRRHREVKKARGVKEQLDETIATAPGATLVRIVNALVSAGHQDVSSLINMANARRGTSTQALTPPTATSPQPPPEPAVGSSPRARSFEPTGQDDRTHRPDPPSGPTINLGDLHSSHNTAGHGSARPDPPAGPSPWTPPPTDARSDDGRWNLG